VNRGHAQYIQAHTLAFGQLEALVCRLQVKLKNRLLAVVPADRDSDVLGVTINTSYLNNELRVDILRHIYARAAPVCVVEWWQRKGAILMIQQKAILRKSQRIRAVGSKHTRC